MKKSVICVVKPEELREIVTLQEKALILRSRLHAAETAYQARLAEMMSHNAAPIITSAICHDCGAVFNRKLHSGCPRCTTST